MAGSRLRAFQTYGTSANLRASLLEFASSGGGFVSSLVPAAQGRISGQCQDIAGLKPISFEKFVGRMLTLGGQTMRPIADPMQELEALGPACRELPPSSPYHACREYPDFVRRLRATLSELALWRLSGPRLAELSAKAEPRLAAKLESLSLANIGLAAGLCAAARERESDRLERCLALTLQESAASRLWLYSGSEFAPLYCEWTQWAVANGVELWLVLDGHRAASGLFRGAARTLEALQLEARFVGGANGLAEGLFAEQASLDPGLGVRIISASDPLAEAEWALRAICDETYRGMAWSRGAIYVRNPDEYGPLLETAAARLGVPLSLSRKESLSSNALVRFLSRFLSACADESPAALKSLAASSYVGLAKGGAEHCRQSIVLSLSDTDPWQGLGQRLDAGNDSDAWLFDAIRLHRKNGLGAISPKEWTGEIEDLLEGGWLAEALDDKRVTAARDEAAKSAFVKVVGQHADFAEHSGTDCDLPGFLEAIGAVASQATYSLGGSNEGLPVFTSGYSLGQAEILCVLGMIEGAFPRRRSEDPILSDFERGDMDALRPGQPCLLNSHDHARAERDELVRVCAAAGKDVVFFYPQVGDDRDNTPAFYLGEIRRAGHPKHEADIPSARIAPPRGECLFEADERLRTALDSPKAHTRGPELESEAAKAALRGIPKEGLSPAELRDALQCPFKFEFQRRLRLDARRRSSPWHRIRFLPESAGLPLVSTPEEAQTALEQALQAELDDMAHEVEPPERRLYEAGGRREIRGWVEREFLARELWRKKEGHLRAGVPFGEAETAGELPLNGERIKIRGRLASVGDLGDIAVGMLYGSKSFGAKGGLDKMEDPDVLELGIHLWALCKRKRSVGLEVDTSQGERLLLLLPRPPDADIQSRAEKGLRVVELGEKQAFYERVKELLAVSVERIREGEVGIRNGDHCDFCDYGELCRRAKGYGEQPDPFQPEALDGD